MDDSLIISHVENEYAPKIIKIVATRCQILRLKCTKFDFGWGAYSAPPDSLVGFEGAYF